MDIQIQIDQAQVQPKIVIYTQQVTPEITQLISRLSSPSALIGYSGSQVYPLSPKDVVRIYTDGQKIFAETLDRQHYSLKGRLYEWEEQLEGQGFIRISHSELANMHHVRTLDLSLTGSITLVFQSGVTTFVSRRQMKKIKQYLHI